MRGRTLVLLFTRVVGNGVQYAIILLVAALLDPAESGRYLTAYALIQVASVLGRAGQDNGQLREVPAALEAGRVDAAWGTIVQALATSVAAAALLALLAVTPWARWSGGTGAWFASALVLWTVHWMISASVQALGRPVLVSTARDVVQPVTQCLLLLFLPHVTAADALRAFTLSCLLATLLSVISVLRWVRAQAPTPRYPRWVFVRRSFPLLLVSGANQSMRWMDTLLVGTLLGGPAAALYTPIARTVALVTLPLSALNVMYPQRAAALYAAGNHELLDRETRGFATFSFAGAVVLTLLAIPAMRVGAPYLLPLTQTAGGQATAIFLLLALGQLVNAAVGPVGFLLMMTRFAWLEFRNVVFTVVLSTVAMVLAVPALGPVGAALGTATAMVVVNALRAWQVERHLTIRVLSPRMFVPMSLLLAGAVAAVVSTTGASAVAPRALAAAVFVGVLALAVAVAARALPRTLEPGGAAP